ncbi:MAG TPA: CHAT domain-containing tetratricopeptide repeat protein [Acetobacteraceae bacterium]|nr:CHAT domain-containing tetratricopeptide repeat protein [Acetobacteraceae bacterium]
MRSALRLALVPLAMAPFALASCARPPASVYVNAVGFAKPAAQVSVGKNSVGEACTQSITEGNGADIYCGTWQQPSARVRPGPAATQAQLAQLATSGVWRAGIDERFACQAPTATSILGGEPAELMQCTQRIGGWPHVALVALVDGKAWFADGVLPAASVMQRSIGVQSGLISAGTAPPSSAADALLAQRLAAQAFSSGDVGSFDRLMAAGTRANLADNAAAAEAAFRAALALQRKALGKDNPNTATALMTLALQLSDGGSFTEATALFAEAERLAPGAADPTAIPRLAHYRGLDQLNRGQYEAALALLKQAEAGYRPLVPPSVLRTRVAVDLPSNSFSRIGRVGADLAPSEGMLTDPSTRAAILGLIEARRNEGLVLRKLDRIPESQTVLASARELAQSSGLARPILEARLLRTTGVTAAAAGNSSAALSNLSASSQAFSRSLPESKPLADTYLLRAGELARAGRGESALPICQLAVAALVALKAGTAPSLMSPCLDAYAAAAAAQPPAERQKLLAEMFTAAQLAQAGITSQQIAQATARLQENARDPKVAEAIRKRQDSNAELQALYRQRDALAVVQTPGGGAAPPAANAESTELDKRITAAQAALAAADAALQAASPNYGQLVQEVVPAADVFAALHPHEAFVSIVLGNKDGWSFLLRDGAIAIAKVDGGTPRMAKLVHDVRAGIELTSAGLPTFNIPGARELYSATLGGFGKRLDGLTELVVAPSGPLLSIPFEVLLTGPADEANLAGAPWLLNKFAIAHVPAPSNFVSLRKIAGGSRATQSWFGFGDFQPVTLAQAELTFPGSACKESAELFAGLPTLPYARKELDVARQIFGSSPADELLGRAFTAPAVMKAQLKDYRILHFATHALLPAELRCQSEPAIITSDPVGATNANGALLTASDVVGMDLDANLVILSACNSGGPGGTTAGESLSGLARAFFFAGARALMVTHWAVNDQVAAYLVAGTLGKIRDQPGIGAAAALRATQLTLLQGAGHGLPAEIAHPFFWAPFAVIGEGGARPAGKVVASAR